MSQGAGEKTERATAKKRRDARERGQVLKSTEVNTAFCSIVMFGFLVMNWHSLTEKLRDLYLEFLQPTAVLAASDAFTEETIRNLAVRSLLALAEILAPVLGVALLAGILINLVQVGFLFTTKPLMPKLSNIDPIKGFQKIFSIRTLTELIKSLLKVICLGYIAYSEYKKLLPLFLTLVGADLYACFIEIMRRAFVVALKMCLVMAVIAAFDYLFQWWKYEKDLRMTKQEVKDEYKMTEGDPQIKGKIRQKQRQMSAMRMMENVPQADVVITNPTHYAVALKYEEGQRAAPIVVAKGQDFLARKIKEVARAHGIEIVENKPLAQALYQYCEVDDEVPAEFYQAVAEILVYVYRQKQRMRGGSG